MLLCGLRNLKYIVSPCTKYFDVTLFLMTQSAAELLVVVLNLEGQRMPLAWYQTGRD